MREGSKRSTVGNGGILWFVVMSAHPCIRDLVFVCGLQVPGLLQHHHRVQPLAVRCAVRQLLCSTVHAHWRQGTPD